MANEIPGARFDADLAAMVRARAEGRIDGIGLSNVSRDHLLRAAPRISPPAASASTRRRVRT
jgi:diketogulonate reductase-like aldo/keto reductase